MACSRAARIRDYEIAGGSSNIEHHEIAGDSSSSVFQGYVHNVEICKHHGNTRVMKSPPGSQCSIGACRIIYFFFIALTALLTARAL
jgi:hypothetical protein